jgi:hypothetical protein
MKAATRRALFNLICAVIVITVAVAVISAVVSWIEEHTGIVITAIAVLGAIAIALLVNKLINKRYEKLIRKENIYVNALIRLNQKYDFTEIENLDLTHKYDNENFYNDISEEDFLTYNLVHSKNKILNYIAAARQNAKMYAIYEPQVCELKKELKSDLQIYAFFKRKYRRVAAKVFKNTTLCPVIDIKIEVCLILTNIRGLYKKSKTKVFEADKIEAIIRKLNNTDNGFYKDGEIWQSISRVERGKVSNKMRFAIYRRDGNRCRICGSRKNLEVDHIFPIAKGGKTTFDNLQTLCHRCNAKKSDTVTPSQREEYYKAHGGRSSTCPRCNNGRLVKKHGRNGEFLGCSNYPECKFTKSI